MTKGTELVSLMTSCAKTYSYNDGVYVYNYIQY